MKLNTYTPEDIKTIIEHISNSDYNTQHPTETSIELFNYAFNTYVLVEISTNGILYINNHPAHKLSPYVGLANTAESIHNIVFNYGIHDAI